MECYWCLTEHEGVCPAAPYYVGGNTFTIDPRPEEKMDAMERARELMATPSKDLPPLAYKYAQELCRTIGISAEVMITAFAFYAQIVEGLPCEEECYVVGEANRRFFNERVKNA
jgi:hypothetical protein